MRVQDFMVHFRLTNTGQLEFEEFDDVTEDALFGEAAPPAGRTLPACGAAGRAVELEGQRTGAPQAGRSKGVTNASNKESTSGPRGAPRRRAEGRELPV